MRLKTLVCLIAIPLLFSCRHSDHDSKNRKSFHTKSPHFITGKDTLIIDHRTAVSVLLDSLGLEKNKKKYSDTAIEAYTEDGAYYDYLADSVMKQKKLPVIQAIHYKYLKFIQKNGATTVIRVDTLSQISTLYFFDPIKPPHLVDVTDIENEYKNFFR